MILRTPEYYSAFHCVAGACPQNCCIGWEVVVDGETAACYRSLPGAMGERLRGALTADEEGDCCLIHQGRRCPFLNPDNLCRIYMELGPSYTSEVCRTHPRFTEEFGSFREISLSASCPEAARLLLSQKTPLRFPEREIAAQESEPDEWLAPLLACRTRMLAILEERTLPWNVRAAWMLLLANDAQALLDGDRLEEMGDLCDACAALPEELPEEVRLQGAGLFPAALRILEHMEILEDDWLPTLRAAEQPPRLRLEDWALERICCYFLFRCFLHAVNDGDLLSRAELAVFAPLVVERLAGQTVTTEAALYRFCREVEHDADNLETLRTDFCADPAVGLTQFFQELECRKSHC